MYSPIVGYTPPKQPSKVLTFLRRMADNNMTDIQTFAFMGVVGFVVTGCWLAAAMWI